MLSQYRRHRFKPELTLYGVDFGSEIGSAQEAPNDNDVTALGHSVFIVRVY